MKFDEAEFSLVGPALSGKCITNHSMEIFMKSKAFGWMAVIMVLALGSSAQAQTPRHMNFTGTLNDHTVAIGIGGPWEVRGHWTLKVKGDSGKADFSAALTMERSDQGVATQPTNPNGPANFDDPTKRNAHTHHITLTDGVVTEIPNGFRVTSPNPTIVTGNGAYPPPFGVPSFLQIDITGVTGAPGNVAFSNIAVTFSGMATKHFGTTAINGVVRSVDKEDAAGH